MSKHSSVEELTNITRQLSAIHEQVTCLNEVRAALTTLEHYAEGLTGHLADPIAKLHIECGKNELAIRQQIAALGESVAATLQPTTRRPIVAKGLLMTIVEKPY